MVARRRSRVFRVLAWNAPQTVAAGGRGLVETSGAGRASVGCVVVAASVETLVAFHAAWATFTQGACRAGARAWFAFGPFARPATQAGGAADVLGVETGIAGKAIVRPALVGVLPRTAQIAPHRTAAALGIPTGAQQAGAVGVVGFAAVLAFFAHAATAAAGVGGGAPHHAGETKHLSLVFLVKPTGAINADVGRDGAAVTTRFAVGARDLLHVRLPLAGQTGVAHRLGDVVLKPSFGARHAVTRRRGVAGILADDAAQAVGVSAVVVGVLARQTSVAAADVVFPGQGVPIPRAAFHATGALNGRGGDGVLAFGACDARGPVQSLLGGTPSSRHTRHTRVGPRTALVIPRRTTHTSGRSFGIRPRGTVVARGHARLFAGRASRARQRARRRLPRAIQTTFRSTPRTFRQIFPRSAIDAIGIGFTRTAGFARLAI